MYWVIIINHTGTLENKAHEVRQVSQYDQKLIKFTSTNEVSGPLGKMEIEAYLIQYIINKNTMPASTTGYPKSTNDININWLRGVNDGNGNFPYRNHR